METYFPSSGNSMILFGVIFLLLEIEIKGKSVLTEKYFSTNGNHFPLFFVRKTVFPYSGNVVFNECFILAGGNGFSG